MLGKSSQCQSVLLVLLCLALVGCASFQRWLSGSLFASDWYQLQPASALHNKVDASHFVVAQFGEHKFSSINQIEWNNDRIALASFSHMGGPLFALTYDGNNLAADVSPLLPSMFHEGFVLKDYQLIFLPITEVIKGIKNSDINVVEEDKQRYFYNGDRLLIRVVYNANDRWRTGISFENLERDYTLTFSSISEE